jgi:hypothetical protein
VDADVHGQMFDPLFSFMDSDSIMGLSNDETGFVLQAETGFDFMEKAGIDRAASVPKKARRREGAKIEVPVDLLISLLRPDELEQLRKYAIAYSKKYMSEEG